MTLSCIISTKTSKSPGKKTHVSQNTFENTPEDDLDTFCDIISDLTSKYIARTFWASRIAGPERSGL